MCVVRIYGPRGYQTFPLGPAIRRVQSPYPVIVDACFPLITEALGDLNEIRMLDGSGRVLAVMKIDESTGLVCPPLVL